MAYPMKSILTVIAVVTVSVALSACSSSDGSSLPQPDAVSTVTTEVSPPTTSAQARLAGWHIAPADSPSDDATNFTASVMSVQCGGGPFITTEVSAEADRIIITLAQEPYPGPQTCVGRPPESYTVEIGEPIGDRTLIDGMCIQNPGVGGGLCDPDGVRWPLP
jgi:hypothetical protein